jgi:hypothetical protein
MLQLFLKSTQISPDDWARAYQKIGELTAAFPLKLIRIEAYNGYDPNQDKEHFDLVVERGTAEEHIAFYGDFISYTAGTSIRFYKNWEKHRQLALEPCHSDPAKPITWFAPTPFKNDGSVPKANGESTKYGYIDTRGACYEYAILAIGILLENLLPGRALLTAPEQDIQNIERVVEWLEGHFGGHFDLPIYFAKKRLLDSFVSEYADKTDAVERMEHLYRKQFKRNMAFAFEHLGYEPTFRCYARVLCDCRFGTFGFWDVLNPWIAATQNLESTLQLVSESKRLLTEGGKTEDANEYDLNEILETLLGQFVLWTPLEREELEPFYTNKQALETGNEDIWGTIFRMTGHRVDICPIVASPDELFETFMYHDPKNGAVFKKTIDDWREKNVDAFEQLKAKLSLTVEHEAEEDEEEAEFVELGDQSILRQYPAHEQFLIRLAIQANPAYFRLDEALQALRERIRKTIEGEEYRGYVQQIRAESNADKKTLILQQLKQKRDVVTAGANFEQWLSEETNEQVLLFLRLLMSMKIYDRQRAYARYRILHDHELWSDWRKE